MGTKDFKPKAWVAPQPVLIIGTYNENGVPNAMNAAWAGQCDTKEIMISMGNHATTKNLNRCPEFTVAFATVDTMKAADYIGIVSADTEPDKIKVAGWNAKKGKNVSAPVFDCFPLTFECRIEEKIYDCETRYYIIAEIVNIICDERYLSQNGLPDIEKMNLITFDPIHHRYIALGSHVGEAFKEGNALR